MSRADPFDTIWRETLNPKLVQIPSCLYAEYMPRVDVYPLAVHDPAVIAIDAKFQESIGKAFGIVNSIVESVKPVGIGIPMRHLIDQIPFVLSGQQLTLSVYRYRRLLKTVPVGRVMLEQCKVIQSILLERLLLFEDMGGVAPRGVEEEWTGPTHGAQVRLSHVFRRGGKADALLDLCEVLVEEAGKVVVFVRNVLVCEAICDLLLESGRRAAFVHGRVEERERAVRLGRFRHGDIEVLVASRQLYGRGFDLPQATASVFYSPKDSARTMWQEVLRIRGTVRNPKPAYILFYAWTAEASKFWRLIQGMLRTNAEWKGFWFRWVYSEPSVFEGKRRDRTDATLRTPKKRDRESSTASFVDALMQSIDAFRREKKEVVVRALGEIADRTGFADVWPSSLVKSLLFQLGEAIAYLSRQDVVKERKIKKELSKVLHPDMHPTAKGEEKKFWHELFVAFGQL